MKAFCQLFEAIDQTTRTSEKVAALETYFRTAPPEDAAWALKFLCGYRLKRGVKTTLLRQWAAEAAGLPLWLLEECYSTVGDLGETLALILPETISGTQPQVISGNFTGTDECAPGTGVNTLSLSRLVETRLLPLPAATEAQQRELLRQTWAELDTPQRFLWHKLLTGNFRVGVARALLVRALANVGGVDPAIMSHRLMGEWAPTAEDFHRLLSGELSENEPARPYPFYLASPREQASADLGDPREWQFEWKWDGIRAQLIRRAGQAILWSRGEEVITPAFPEIEAASRVVPDGTVLDGELLAWQGDSPLPFARLQRRLNRREASAKLQLEVPVVFLAYDLLEISGADCRAQPLSERRLSLETLLSSSEERFQTECRRKTNEVWRQGELFGNDPTSGNPEGEALRRCPIRLSPLLSVPDWESLEVLQKKARTEGTEGIMLKRLDSPYGAGRQRGAWWKWKVSPFTCDAVLVAAQPGHGRRATLFTDYTFAVWHGEELSPVAKAYSGLTDEEIDSVDAFVRENTTGTFGPLRTVKPRLVFELAFEGIAESNRHKSGIALRFPRIARWRHDKKPSEADTLENLRKLLENGPGDQAETRRRRVSQDNAPTSMLD